MMFVRERTPTRRQGPPKPRRGPRPSHTVRQGPPHQRRRQVHHHSGHPQGHLTSAAHQPQGNVAMRQTRPRGPSKSSKKRRRRRRRIGKLPPAQLKSPERGHQDRSKRRPAAPTPRGLSLPKVPKGRAETPPRETRPSQKTTPSHAESASVLTCGSPPHRRRRSPHGTVTWLTTILKIGSSSADPRPGEAADSEEPEGA